MIYLSILKEFIKDLSKRVNFCSWPLGIIYFLIFFILMYYFSFGVIMLFILILFAISILILAIGYDKDLKNSFLTFLFLFGTFCVIIMNSNENVIKVGQVVLEDSLISKDDEIKVRYDNEDFNPKVPECTEDKDKAILFVIYNNNIFNMRMTRSHLKCLNYKEKDKIDGYTEIIKEVK